MRGEEIFWLFLPSSGLNVSNSLGLGLKSESGGVDIDLES